MKPVYMGLNALPASDQAKALCSYLINMMNKPGGTIKRRTDATDDALSAIVSDLLWAAENGHDGWCYRPVAADEFTGEPISSRGFKRAIGFLENQGYVVTVPGTCAITPAGKVGEASKFQATPLLLRLAAKHDVHPSEWTGHFAYRRSRSNVSNPVILKTECRYRNAGKESGIRIKLQKTHFLTKLENQVNDLNSYISKFEIDGAAHIGFRRIFCQGNTVGAGFTKGGRLYSIGGGYQNESKLVRRNILINGESTTEIDLKACFLTILHGLTGTPLPEGADPYATTRFPRGVIKAFTTMAFGKKRLPTAWSKTALEGYGIKGTEIDEDGRRLSDFDIKEVRNALLAAVPLMKSWNVSKYRWGDFQFIESRVIIKTMERLVIEFDTPSLPVHDSLIVPTSKTKVASEVLANVFTDIVGISPIIDC